MQDGVEDVGPTRSHLTGVDDEYSGGSDHCKPVCAVPVKDEMSRTVENPPLGVSVCGDAGVHRGADARRVEPVANQRCELGHRRQVRRRIARSPEFLEDEGKLDEIFGADEVRPTLIDVPLPKRASVGATFSDLPNKGRRTLLRHCLLDRFAPKTLVIVEF